MSLRDLENEIDELEKHDIIIIIISLGMIFSCFALVSSLNMVSIYKFTAENILYNPHDTKKNPTIFSEQAMNQERSWSLKELFDYVGETAEKKAFLEGLLIDIALLLMIFEVMLHVHKLEDRVLKSKENKPISK